MLDFFPWMLECFIFGTFGLSRILVGYLLLVRERALVPLQPAAGNQFALTLIKLNVIQHLHFPASRIIHLNLWSWCMHVWL